MYVAFIPDRPFRSLFTGSFNKGSPKAVVKIATQTHLTCCILLQWHLQMKQLWKRLENNPHDDVTKIPYGGYQVVALLYTSWRPGFSVLPSTIVLRSNLIECCKIRCHWRVAFLFAAVAFIIVQSPKGHAQFTHREISIENRKNVWLWLLSTHISRF